MAYKLSSEIQTLLDEYRELREEMEAYEAELSRLHSRQYAIKGEIAALEIPPLKAEMEANNEKIAHLEERKRYYEADLKIREAQKKELLRKQRNRRIFTRGGMLESFLQEPLLMTDEAVHDFLLEVFRMPEVDALLRKVLHHHRPGGNFSKCLLFETGWGERSPCRFPEDAHPSWGTDLYM